MVLAQKADGVLLVLNAGLTRRAAAARAAESLQQVGANVIGAVLNAVPSGRGGYYSYYYQDYCYQDMQSDGQPVRRERKRRPGLMARLEQWLDGTWGLR